MLYLVDCVSPAEVAEFEYSGLWIQQQVLGLDVPMADPKGMDVGQAPEQLVHVQLHTETRIGYDYINSKLSFQPVNNHLRIIFSPVKYATVSRII